MYGLCNVGCEGLTYTNPKFRQAQAAPIGEQTLFSAGERRGGAAGGAAATTCGRPPVQAPQFCFPRAVTSERASEWSSGDSVRPPVQAQVRAPTSTSPAQRRRSGRRSEWRGGDSVRYATRFAPQLIYLNSQL